MAKNRYSNTAIIDGKYYGTFRLPIKAGGLVELNLLDGVRSFQYTYKVGDRLDKLAAKYFNGESSYWWIIAACNNIAYPFASGGLIPGRVLRIPTNVKDVLDKIYG